MSRIAKKVLLVNRADEALLPMIATAETVEENNMDPITSDAAAKNLALKAHSHEISNVTGLQAALNGKEAKGTCLPLTGGTVEGNITLHGSISSPDVFQVIVSSGGTYSVLQAFHSGSISWREKELERVNEIGQQYIRYESGVQFCWGYVSNAANTTTVTFPKAFATTSSTGVSITPINQQPTIYVSSIDTAKMILAGTVVGSGTRWIAIGKWK